MAKVYLLVTNRDHHYLVAVSYFLANAKATLFLNRASVGMEHVAREMSSVIAYGDQVST